MEAKVKAQTAPNKDVQKEIADLGEVVFLYLLCFFLKTGLYSVAHTSLKHTIQLRLASDLQLSPDLSMSLQT